MSLLIRKFASANLGAPVLNGVVGSMIGLLDAILVDGYGSVAISSMTRSGSTVTVQTSSPHGLDVDDIPLIAGASESDYNGVWSLTSVPDSTHYTFDIGLLTPTSPATGSISSKRAPLGWTKVFTGTNKVVYRLPTLAGASGRYLRIDDSNALYAIPRMYETMSDVDTGTNPSASTYAWDKSTTANSTARVWHAFGDDRLLWLLPRWHATYLSQASVYGFGDAAPFSPIDLYCQIIVANLNAGGSYPGHYNLFMEASSAFTTLQSGHQIMRPYNQVGGVIGFGKYSGVMPAGMVGSMVYPSPYDNGLYVAPVSLIEPSIVRGLIPGVLASAHGPSSTASLTDFLAIDGIAGLPGRKIMKATCGSVSIGNPLFFDITGPWR